VPRPDAFVVLQPPVDRAVQAWLHPARLVGTSLHHANPSLVWTSLGGRPFPLERVTSDEGALHLAFDVQERLAVSLDAAGLNPQACG
jgi:hypothetical protein